nr:putative ribonuclease H-like domain-containing protein [Tanacetum cinerariifolium]
MLDQTFDRLQKLVSLLELLEENLLQEDVNQKLLRSLSPEWNTHVVVWRNKADLDTMSMDDLHNNLKVYEPEVKRVSSSSSSTQNMAFVSSSNNNTSRTNGAVNTTQVVDTTHRVSTASTQVNVVYSTNIAPRNQDNKYKKSLRMSVPMETPTSTALVSCDGLGGYDWSDRAEEGPNYALMAFSSLSFNSEVSNDTTCFKSCLETVKLLKSQNDQLLKDLKKYELIVLVENCKAMSSEEEPKVVRKNDDALIIEEWASDNEEEDVSQPKIEKKIVMPNIAKIEFGNPQIDLQDQGMIDSGCSRHMTGNMSYLTDYKEIDKGYVAFGGNPKGGKITKKVPLKLALIEAAKTMLADSKLPTTFWIEAVNTACYFQNKVLVVQPHNKTSYELFHGRTPTLSFMRPFGCFVTILNTIDHLGKFNGKANKGFFVGYSLNSKGFRVFNSRTRIVEENLHIRFSESTRNVVGSQPDWLFDIDALTRTMNYEPIVTGTQSNGFADLNTSNDDGSKPSNDDRKKVDEDARKENKCNDQEKEDNANNTNNVNTISLTFNTAGTNGFNDIDEEVYVCQPPGFEDPDFSDRAYKVEKALYGLHQAPRAWHKGDILLVQVYVDIIFGLQVKQKKDGTFISQDKYVAKILKKFGFTKVKTTSTPMETQKPLLKDDDGEEVDVHMYRSMIGLLMYFTSSRPDIVFVVYAYARYQVNSKVSHLYDVNMIFRYLKGQPKLGLWYLKDSLSDLVAYTVGIKTLLDAVGITATHVSANTTQLELVLLVNINESYTKCLLLLMIDYALWEVIENGATLPKTQVVEGVTTVMSITTVKEKAQRRLEVKASSTLMMGISNEHQLKFNSVKDAKKLLEAIKKDLLVSQLELLDEKLSEEDVNNKLLRSLSPEWNTHAVVWRNKADLDTMSMDNLYNNLKVYEPEVKGMSSPSLSTQNMVFVSFSNNNSSSPNGTVNTAHEDLEQIHPEYIEEIDLRWKMAMLTIRSRGFLKRTGRKLTVNRKETISFDKTNVECYNCHKRGHFARVIRQKKGLIMHSWLSHLQVLTQ